MNSQITVGIWSRPAIFTASRPEMLAEGRIEPDFAVALAQVIAFAVRTAFVRTAGLDDRRNGNALLIDAHLPTKKKKTINQNFSRNKVTQKKKKTLLFPHLAPLGTRPGSTSCRPKSTLAVRHGMIFPSTLKNEWDKTATDSIPNSSLSFKWEQCSKPQWMFLNCPEGKKNMSTKVWTDVVQAARKGLLNVLVATFRERVIELEVAAVARLVAVCVLVVTLCVRTFAGGSPE